MTIIESKVTPGGSDPVPYGEGTCEIPYCDHVGGTIEIDCCESYIRSGIWKEQAAEIIYEEHHSDLLTLSDVFAYVDYVVNPHPTKPGTYLITYSV